MSELNQEEQQQEEVRENSEQDTLKLGVSRRTFIGTGMTAAAAALVLPRQAIADDLCDDPNNDPDLDPLSGQDFMQPKLIVVEPNSPSIILSATSVRAANGDITRRFCYNGQKMLPGPTFRVSPGSELNIEYTNELPDNFDFDTHVASDYQYPQKVNITNLHFHGLHVSPLSLDCDDTAVSGNAGNSIQGSDDVLIKSSSDDVLIEINPGSENLYKVHIPEEHAPGTHWYHPHLHGSTAVQVVNGMAGAIIIEEPPGERLVPEERDFVFVIQDIETGTHIYDQGLSGGEEKNLEIMVNGQKEPILSISSNTMYRLRFINATALPSGFITLKFMNEDEDDSPIHSRKIEESTDTAQCRGVYRVAVDGISHYGMPPEPVDPEGWDMSPGNRADFLVMLDEGRYKVEIQLDEVNNKGKLPQNGDVDRFGTLASICVMEGPDAPEPECIFPNIIPLHTNLSNSYDSGTHYLSPFRSNVDIDEHQTVTFSRSKPNALINNEAYGPDTPEFNVGIDTEEIWELCHGGGGSAHPFHIHVNPFQVIEIEGDSDHDYKNIWFDTFFVANRQPVKIRHRFKDYVGKFVFHCHILLHEDRGMMRNINVTGCGKGPGSNGGMINWPDNGTQADPYPGGVELST